MIIGVELNDVLRDFIGKFQSVYIKYKSEEPIKPINSYPFENHFKFENGVDEMNKFLYDEAALEIFGHANEVETNIVNHLNLYYTELNKTGKHKLIIISREAMNSIPASYFFLAKTSCKISNIIFTTKFEEEWNYADIIITAHPRVLESKPKDKISIKIDKEYNSLYDADYTIKTLKDFLKEDNILDKISNTKTISYEDV